MNPRFKKVKVGAAILATSALALSACGSSGGGDAGDKSADAVAAALEEGGEITLWTWEPTMSDVVDQFMVDYPQVKVNLVNAGQTTDQYSAIHNAIAAGSGIPDIAQIEYMVIPQFTQVDSLVDVAPYGAGELGAEYSPGTWNAVTGGTESVYGLPLASAPMGLFYNEALFAEHGIDIPTTWDDYLAAARALKAIDPGLYITNETGNPVFHLALIWQAGGNPFSVDGTTIAIDFDDAGTKRYADLWDTMLAEELIAPVSTFSDEWYQAVGDGSVATLPSGAWMRPNLESGVPAGEGNWRVALMPEWEAGTPVSAEHGGTAMSLIQGGQSGNEALAYAFVEYSNLLDGVDNRVSQGAFPPTTKHLGSDEFGNTEVPYFSGQKSNLVLAESSESVIKGWSFLPIQAHANSIYNDYVGPTFSSGAPMMDSLQAWGDAISKYADQQGFDVQE